jgi:hypothetical protein
MSWIDSCASLSASRGGRCPVVAAGFDEIAFVAPLRLGEHAVIDSKVTRSWGTSLEATHARALAHALLALAQLAHERPLQELLALELLALPLSLGQQERLLHRKKLSHPTLFPLHCLGL